MIGIYRIKNKINEKCYYGSSIDIDKRWNRHINDLIKNKHHNFHLQNAWNKYGENNFKFEIIEECDLENLHYTEQKYLDLNPEYNIGITSCGGDNITKNPNRKDIIKKMSESLKNRFKSMTDEEKKEKYSRPMENNPNWKGGTSYVYCKCGKRIGFGNTFCQKCRPRSDKDNPFYGKKHSNEYKIKSSKNMMGKYAGEQNKPIIINDVEYRSYGVAYKILCILPSTIRHRVLSKNPKYKNYQYVGEIKESFTIEEQSERLSNPHKGKKRNWNKSFVIDEIEYRTLKEASEKLLIHPMTIKGRLLSKNFENYNYK